MGLFKKRNKVKKGFQDVSMDVSAFSATSSGIDFTLLDPRATEKDIESLCNIAFKNKYYAVIVSPVFVRFARNFIDTKLSSSIKVGTVVGFPLGGSTIKSKIAEAKEAIKNGAEELDVCICVNQVKQGDYAYIKYEMSRIVRLSRKVVVKAIIETAYLTPEEIEKVVHALVRARVDYIMTSTGYAPLGADLEVVEKIINLLSRSKVMVKASGGIKTKAQVDNYFRLGVSRIGTSRII